MLAWLSFYVWLQLTALAALPLCTRVFHALPDRGFACCKFLGLLIVSYGVWALSMLGFLQHTRASLLVAVGVLAVVCWATWGRELPRRLAPIGVLAAFEALFLVVFGGTAVIRAFNADINGQEKFMDFAFMNTFITASRLPAEDAWFSGHATPYYHFAYFVMASASELAGVAAPVGYNLAVALVLSLTVIMCASLIFNSAMLLPHLRRGDGATGREGEWADGGAGVSARAGTEARATESPPVAHSPTRPLAAAFVWGILGATLVGLLGNLAAALEVLAAQGVGSTEFWRWLGFKGLEPSAQPLGWPPAGFNWFRTSRVIPNIQPDGITEFPYFSFLLGDLHPHYMALPFDLLVLALALALALAGYHGFGWAGVAVSGLALGSIIAANTWDIPTFWLTFAAASVWAQARDGRLRLKNRRELGRLALPFGIGIALFLPYYVGYVSQPLGLGLVGERTHFGSMLIVLGPFLLGVLLLGVWGLASGTSVAHLRVLRERWGPQILVFIGLALAAVLLLEIAAGEWTLALLTALLTLVSPLAPVSQLAIESRQPAEVGSAQRLDPQPPTAAVTTIAWFLSAFGLLILFGTELVYLSDSFHSRMNTVFKFYYHAWILLGLASTLALLHVARQLPTARLARAATFGVAGIVIALGSVYPATATPVKSGWFQRPPDLDGSRFLADARPADYRAIAWLRARGADRPIVLEAVGPDYQEYARVSTFSGLPTVLGWVGHELQWRGNPGELSARERDVDAIYKNGDEPTIRRLLNRYAVDYVFVGSLERTKYGDGVDARFARLFPSEYEDDGVTIYRVPRLPGNGRGTG